MLLGLITTFNTVMVQRKCIQNQRLSSRLIKRVKSIFHPIQLILTKCMCWLKESNELGVRYLYEVRTGLLLIVLWSLFSIRSRSSQQRPSAVNFERKNLVKMLTYLCMLRFFLHFSLNLAAQLDVFIYQILPRERLVYLFTNSRISSGSFWMHFK